MNKYILFLILAQLYHAQTPKISTDNVVMIVELARHGSRAPEIKIVKRDYIDESGLQELTPSGQRMHYMLGMNNRKRYPTIFADRLKPDQYFIHSTPFNRTIMSAMSHMLGAMESFDAKELTHRADDFKLLPPQGLLFDSASLEFKTPLPHGFRAFPIHSRLLIDPLVIVDQCPNLISNITEKRAYFSSYLEKSPKFISMLKEAEKRYNLAPGWSNETSLKNCYRLADTAIQDYYNMDQPPIDKEEPLFKQLEKCYTVYTTAMVNETTVRKAAVSDILFTIMNNFLEKSTGNKLNLKYLYFSAHDSTLIPQLYSLGLIEDECLLNDLFTGSHNLTCALVPGLASNIIWELIKEGEEYFVKVSYNAKYIDFCKEQHSKKEDDYKCQLAKFAEVISTKYTDKEYIDTCGMIPIEQKTILKEIIKDLDTYKILFWLLFAACGVFGIMFVVSAVYALKLRRALMMSRINSNHSSESALME